MIKCSGPGTQCSFGAAKYAMSRLQFPAHIHQVLIQHNTCNHVSQSSTKMFATISRHSAAKPMSDCNITSEAHQFYSRPCSEIHSLHSHHTSDPWRHKLAYVTATRYTNIYTCLLWLTRDSHDPQNICQTVFDMS